MSVYDSLKKNLPPFIIHNDIIEGMLQACNDVIGELSDGVDGLPTYTRSGNPLKEQAKSWKIFLSGYETDAEILTLLAKVYEIHQARGSQPAVQDEVSRLANARADVLLFGEQEVGWWADITYPDITADGLYRPRYALTYGDVGDYYFLQIIMNNRYIGEEDLEKLIRDELIPYNVTCHIQFIPWEEAHPKIWEELGILEF